MKITKKEMNKIIELAKKRRTEEIFDDLVRMTKRQYGYHLDDRVLDKLKKKWTD